MIPRPFVTHEELVGSRSATATDKEDTNDVGEMKLMDGSELSQQVPQSETAIAGDKEVTNKKKIWKQRKIEVQVKIKKN